MVLGMKRLDKLMLALHRSIAAVKSQIHYRIDLEHLTDRDKETLQEIYFYLHTKEKLCEFKFNLSRDRARNPRSL